MFSAGVGGDSQGPLKNALQQIQAVRLDSSSLLQTIYLGEIGLQSMSDISKTPVSGSTLPLFSSSVESIAENTGEEMFPENEGEILGKHPNSATTDEQPNAKKM